MAVAMSDALKEPQHDLLHLDNPSTALVLPHTYRLVVTTTLLLTLKDQESSLQGFGFTENVEAPHALPRIPSKAPARLITYLTFTLVFALTPKVTQAEI